MDVWDGSQAREDSRRGGPAVGNRIAGGTFHDVVVQAGTAHLGGTYHSSAQPARSGYLHQVRRLGAQHLVGREQELADLAAFCTAERGPAYLRWQAPAWAGKTALMAWFVLHPPPGVRVVAFFVTARLARQNDRPAFCEVVQRQLYEILGEQEPAVTEYTQDEQLLHALELAARVCEERGERLVLLVDGLDEDRGVTAGPDSHSIAALLPAVPLAGLRVVVAGRPSPPVPDDVPGHHPLRRPGDARVLSVSSFATAVRHDMERELLRLLEADGVERDLLGLLTAAGGGLTVDDLGSLTGSAAWRVHRQLDSVAGRTFRTSNSHWGDDGAEVYLLGHEELQRTAVRMLGPELAGYRSRLHAWGDSYQAQGWPPGTPHYLLRGYTQLLRETGDAARLVRLAVDEGRQRRLWGVSGGDLEALTAIGGAQDLLLSGTDADVDLDAMLVLAVHREVLHGRSGGLPRQLLSMLGRLGRSEQAANFARSAASVDAQVSALCAVIHGMHDRPGTDGESDPRVTDLLEEATGLTATIADPGGRETAMAEIGWALLGLGRTAQALDVAARIAHPVHRVDVLVGVATSCAEKGQSGQALALADEALGLLHSVTNPLRRVATMGRLAAVIAGAGEAERARAVLEEATVLARGIADLGYRASAFPDLVTAHMVTGQSGSAAALTREAVGLARATADIVQRARALARIAAALAAGGEVGGAVSLAHEVVGLARTVTDPDDQMQVLADVVSVLATAGETRQARELAGTLSLPDHGAWALVEVAGTLVEEAGGCGEAVVLAHEALQLAPASVDPFRRTRLLTFVAMILFEAGQPSQAADLVDEALELAHTATNPAYEASMFGRLAGAFRAAGEAGEAVEAAQEAVTHARAVIELRRAQFLALAADALAAAGRFDEAVALARSISDHGQEVRSLVSVARALAGAGQVERALGLARGLTAHPRVRALTDIAVELAAAGANDTAVTLGQEAEDAARGIDDPEQRAGLLAEIADVLIVAGRHGEAAALAREVVAIARVVNDPARQGWPLSAAAGALARAGEVQEARDLARTITDRHSHDMALAYVCAALAAAGHIPDALDLARTITDHHCRAQALATVVTALAEAGRTAEAPDLIPAVTSQHYQVQALLDTAKNAGPDATRRRLCAQALRLGTPGQVIPALPDIAPQSLGVLARTLRTLGHTVRPGDGSCSS
ncbi:P-loop NTPase family protein [Kitasatospora mediocidica]|uniref:hypothetical protein n=1 Tax=Kitasatospora mediocidica TaxID=58352 RepID=UPI0005610AA2|nr:hypothetical protein [Kitasatospora mediocidica]